MLAPNGFRAGFLSRRHVIDPAKVAKTALLNAASIAGLMLTTEALVSEIKEKDEKSMGAPGGGMGGMYQASRRGEGRLAPALGCVCLDSTAGAMACRPSCFWS